MAKMEDDIENIKRRISPLEEGQILVEGAGAKEPSSEQAGVTSDTIEANRTFLSQLDVEGVAIVLA